MHTATIPCEQPSLLSVCPSLSLTAPPLVQEDRPENVVPGALQRLWGALAISCRIAIGRRVCKVSGGHGAGQVTRFIHQYGLCSCYTSSLRTGMCSCRLRACLCVLEFIFDTLRSFSFHAFGSISINLHRIPYASLSSCSSFIHLSTLDSSYLLSASPSVPCYLQMFRLLANTHVSHLADVPAAR